MKKIICLLLALCMSISLVACGDSNSESILKDSVDKVSYATRLREYAVKLYNMNENNLGFASVNTQSDYDRADYIEEIFNEIGLVNIQRVPVNFNSWTNYGVSITFDCNCEDAGYLTLRRTGNYPIDYNFVNFDCSLIYVGAGDSKDYVDKSVSGQGVLLEVSDNLRVQIEEAVKHNPAFIAYYTNVSGYPAAYSMDIEIANYSNIPVFALSYGNFTQLKKYMEDDVVPVTVTGSSVVNSELKSSDFIIGEIEGKNKNKVVYVTAHRDAIQSGFMTSCVSVSELFVIADNLIRSGYKPDYTIRFMVTTGQEWGLLGQGENVGIQQYLDSLSSDELKKIQAVFVVDGNYPVSDTVYTETQVNDSDLKKELINYTDDYFEDSEYHFIHEISDLDNSDTARSTEALVWDVKGVPTILFSEHSKSKYKGLENTSADNVERSLDSTYVDFVIDYYTGLLRELT